MTNEELTRKVVELDESAARHTEQLKTLFSQISEVRNITESIHKLATTVEILVHEQKDTGKKVDKLTEDIETIKEKPAKRWDSAATLVFTVVMTAVITWMLAQIGLK